MTKNRPPHLLLHNLIISLSYWGTAVRILLVGFVFFIATILTAINVDSSSAVQSLAAQYIYFMASLLLLDAGYVTIVRSLPLASSVIDRVMLLILMVALSCMIIIPYFVMISDSILVSTRWVFLVSLFILALRLVLGLILGNKATQR